MAFCVCARDLDLSGRSNREGQCRKRQATQQLLYIPNWNEQPICHRFRDNAIFAFDHVTLTSKEGQIVKVKVANERPHTSYYICPNETNSLPVTVFEIMRVLRSVTWPWPLRKVKSRRSMSQTKGHIPVAIYSQLKRTAYLAPFSK